VLIKNSSATRSLECCLRAYSYPDNVLGQCLLKYGSRHKRNAMDLPIGCEDPAESIFIIISSFRELIQSCGVRRPSVRLSVRPSVNFYANRFFYHKHDWIATKLTQHGPHTGLHPGCAQGQGQVQRSRDTGTSVMSRNVCYTVPSDVLSLLSTCTHFDFTKHH